MTSIARDNRAWGKSADASEDNGRLVRLCHDLRQYVAASRTLADGFISDHRADDSLRSGLSRISEQLAAMSAIISAELESSRQALESVDVAKLVGGCARTAGAARGVEVVVTERSHPVVVAQRLQLQRALGNLLDNACRASTARRVDVSVDTEGPYAVVEIEDDGAGFGLIPRGTGQGLMQARSTLLGMGGLLEIERGNGRGTVARVVLPVLERSVAS